MTVGASPIPYPTHMLGRCETAWNSELAAPFGRFSFPVGLYRCFRVTNGSRGATLIAQVPFQCALRVCRFGCYWLNRQLVLDAGRVEGGQTLALLMEPGSRGPFGSRLWFAAFHEQISGLRAQRL